MTDFAKLERDTLIERTRDGLAAALTQGRVGGRPPKVIGKMLARFGKLAANGEYCSAETAEMVQISRATSCRGLASL